MEHIQPGTQLSRLLEHVQAQAASDLHGRTDHPYSIRIEGKLASIPASLFTAPSAAEMDGLLAESFSPAICERIRREHEVDLSFYYGRMRYRANFSKQRGQQSFAFRTVPPQRMTLADLQLPETLADLGQDPRGLILVTGPTGQGKSTTVRALLQTINETRAMRIITIEDPIEYVFEDDQSHFEQREVGIDTATFGDGIRNAMRQDPNVLFIGEIRDRESIFAAMQAAETGHLVLTTLHADSAAQAIGRIREFYPSSEQANISGLLARNLNAIINQRLIPNVNSGRTPCLEIMRRDKGVQEAIAANDLVLLSGIVEASVNQGMHTFDQYLTELLAAGIISEEIARHYAVNKHRLEMSLRGIVTAAPILRPDEST